MTRPTPGTIAPGLLEIDTSSLTEDERWMYRCLELAAGGAGQVSPHPLVGAVLLGPDGQLLGEGRHEEYGKAHAEVHAVEEAEREYSSEVLKEATLYVNLEPCNHRGKTPPCTDLVLKKQIPRLVVGMADPYPETAGTGLKRLRRCGVQVSEGVLQDACRRLNEAYVHHLETGRPLVTVKVAQTLDGSVATSTGDSQWISAEPSRRLVHRWRASMDAILVGTGTAARDNPRLTVRHVEGPQPFRVVLDRRGRLAPDLNVFTDDHARHTIAVTAPGADPPYADVLHDRGGSVLTIFERNSLLDLHELFEALGEFRTPEGRSIQSVLVEPGTGLCTSLFRQGHADRFFLFAAPKVIGRGKPAIEDLGIIHMDDAVTFAEHAWKTIGDDMLFCGYRHLMDRGNVGT